MSNIRIKLKDGTVREFIHEGRGGGSYTKTLKLEHGFAVVKDEWDKETIFPSEEVLEIEVKPHRAYY